MWVIVRKVVDEEREKKKEVVQGVAEVEIEE